MAKPYADHAGSGLHVHCSVIDKDGKNILDARGGEPAKLKSICVGMPQTMRDAQLVCALRQLLYRRFQPGSFAPVDLTWASAIAAPPSASRTRTARLPASSIAWRARTSIPTCC